MTKKSAEPNDPRPWWLRSDQSIEVGTVHIANDIASAIAIDTWAEIRTMMKNYGGGEDISTTPERIKGKVQAIFAAPDLAAAHQLGKKAVSSFQMHCLSQWASKKWLGPATETNLEGRAKSHDSAALLLDSKKNPEAAQKQRERAAELRAMIPKEVMTDGAE